ncbi:MAG: His/Gly/Thr/Pro-type tRNA ligase C-terminal domain-containing protein, partial [Flavobacteriales bacterium]
VPIYRNDEQLEQLNAVAKDIQTKLQNQGISVKYDNRDTHKPGWKFAQHELQGVPVRITVGARDLENETVELARRDTQEKSSYKINEALDYIPNLLNEIQENIYNKALKHREDNITEVNSYDEFKEVLETKGGFILAHWDGSMETEEKIQEETKATIRCIPQDVEIVPGTCMV